MPGVCEFLAAADNAPMETRRTLLRLAPAIAVAATSLALAAQCSPAPVWAPWALGQPGSTVAVLSHANGEVYACGTFAAPGGGSFTGVAVRQAGGWLPVGSGSPSASHLAELPGGQLVAAGSFTTAGGAPAANIARWDGVSWSALGAGVDGAVSIVRVAQNGDLVVGGSFAQAGGSPAPFLARWDGSSWSGFPSGPTAPVTALAIAPNGELVANGFANGIARWNGSSWQALGTIAAVRSLHVRPDGELLAGAGSGVSRWDGTGWAFALQLSGGQSAANGMLEMPSGELLVFGSFQTCLAVGMTLPEPARGVAVRRGATWSGNGSSIGMPNWTQFQAIRAATVTNAGSVLLAGLLPTPPSGGMVAVQQMGTTCPATVTDLGGGCVGPGGSNLLVPVTLPWVGATFRANASQLPAPALGAVVFGFAPLQLPLTNVFPTALPGCQLLVTPDLVSTPFVPAGNTTAEITLPSIAALAGASLFAQVVAIQLDATGSFLAVTGTNALQATLGSH
jgi:hypothetical protein